MSKPKTENVKMFGFYAPPALMKDFQTAALSQDMSMSHLFRRIARLEILRAAKEAAYIPGTNGLRTERRKK
jgi:hypothetical protein